MTDGPPGIAPVHSSKPAVPYRFLLIPYHSVPLKTPRTSSQSPIVDQWVADQP